MALFLRETHTIEEQVNFHDVVGNKTTSQGSGKGELRNYSMRKGASETGKSTLSLSLEVASSDLIYLFVWMPYDLIA